LTIRHDPRPDFLPVDVRTYLRQYLPWCKLGSGKSCGGPLLTIPLRPLAAISACLWAGYPPIASWTISIIW